MERVRNEVYLLIQRLKGDFERDLSIRWQGLKDVRNPIVRYVPIWVIAVGAAALLVLVYLGFVFAINSASDPVARDLFALAKDEVNLPVQTAAVPTPTPVPPPKPVSKTERFKPSWLGRYPEHGGSGGRSHLADSKFLRFGQ